MMLGLGFSLLHLRSAKEENDEQFLLRKSDAWIPPSDRHSSSFRSTEDQCAVTQTSQEVQKQEIKTADSKSLEESEKISLKLTEGTTSKTEATELSEILKVLDETQAECLDLASAEIDSSVPCEKCPPLAAMQMTTTSNPGLLLVDQEMVDRAKKHEQDQTIYMSVKALRCRNCGKKFLLGCNRVDSFLDEIWEPFPEV